MPALRRFSGLFRFFEPPALRRARRRVPRPAQVTLVALAATMVAACTYAVVPSRPTFLRPSGNGAQTSAIAPGGRAAVQDGRESFAGSGGAGDLAVLSAAPGAPAASANVPAYQGGQTQPSAAKSAQPQPTAAPNTASSTAGANGQALPPLPANERMVVKNGALSVQVSDLAEAVQRANAVVAGIPGAYVAASSTTYRAEDQSGAPKPLPAESRTLPPVPIRPTPGLVQTANLTIKVPVDAFGDALQRLRDLGKSVQESISTQEVTEEYVDLDAQVRNLEATEQQYVRLLDRAQRIEEILPLQQRLQDVRSQIERLRGRMNLLQRRTDLSTITLTLTLPAKGSETVAGEPRIVRTAREALSRLGTVLAVAADAAIYLVVYALPFLPFVAAYWWWRRSRRPTSPASAVAM